MELYRSRDRILGGVCGGLAAFLGVPPWVVRFLWAVAAVLTVGVAAVAYVVLWIVLPEEPPKLKPVAVPEPETVKPRATPKVPVPAAAEAEPE